MSDKQAPEGELIKSTKEIQQILSRLSERATPISIYPDDSSCTLTTYIASLQAQQGLMKLDAPLPQQRHNLLHARKLTFTARYNGCLLTLTDVSITPTTDVNGELAFMAAIPESIYYLQRRRSYRAPVRPLLDIFASLPYAAEATVTGRLKDLSVDGCRIELTGNLMDDFSDLSETLPLSLSFPDSSRFSVELRILRAEYASQHDRTHLGCCFISLTTTQKQYLSRLVTDLQRDHINYMRNEASNTAGTPALFMPAEHRIVAGNAQRPDTETSPVQQASPGDTSLLTPKPIFPVSDTVAPIDIRRAHQSGITAIKSLITRLRSGQALPIEQAQEASQQLLQALRQDPQGLAILCIPRDSQTFLFQHSISYAISLADTLATQYGEQIKDEMLEGLILGGLCHELSRALLPDGIQSSRLELDKGTRSALSTTHMQLVNLLNALPDIARETLYIVSDCHERLDGSGLPNGHTDQALNRVSKLAAVVYAHEKLSQCWHNCDWHYHPLRAFKQLAEMPDQFHQPSMRLLLKQQGKYPLGSTVELNDATMALVMRLDDQQHPSHLRIVYNARFNSLVPPRDRLLNDDSGLKIERATNPLRYEISSQLLKLPLRT
ncbi:flagellar regulator YcgR PilZN domain-containing protein [Nitrincola sp.]|uniref:flagellar regulator YcgR PilZN domain-containing protein n=1 Tax=Nitrincola sp. TaxID=1926584 RepID=UPI003A9403DE